MDNEVKGFPLRLTPEQHQAIRDVSHAKTTHGEYTSMNDVIITALNLYLESPDILPLWQSAQDPAA